MTRAPMRLSVDETDPGYNPLAGRSEVRILLNGEQLEPGVITADEAKGTVAMYSRGHDGLIEMIGGHPMIVHLRGEVRIILKGEE